MKEFWCIKFDKDHIDGKNIITTKEWEPHPLIKTTRDMIRRCLQCKAFAQQCDDAQIMLDFLDANKFPDDWEQSWQIDLRIQN